MNSNELKRLADLMVTEANVLIDHGCDAGAYHTLGYAVECALKACIATRIREAEVPERALITGFYTHDLEQLLSLSGLKTQFLSCQEADPGLRHNWAIARDWRVESRYAVQPPEGMAREMLAAVTHAQSGVLTWLRSRW